MCWLCRDLGNSHEAVFVDGVADGAGDGAGDVPVTGSGTATVTWPLSQSDLNDRIQALTGTWGPSNFALNTSSNAPRSFTYQFETAKPADLPSYWGGSYPANRWGSFTASEKSVVRDVLAEYAKYINVTFTEVQGQADADISLNHASIESFYGGRGSWYWQNGGTVYDGWVIWNTTRTLSDPSARYLVAHELGHAMSLKHPGNYDVNPANAPPPPYLPSAEDNGTYSVMSYNGTRPSGLMLYDIAALQWRWGANLSYKSGDDVYGAPAGGAFTIIWDGGGTDRIDLSASAAAAKIDLRPGSFSSIGGTFNVAIAYGATIENATGSKGADLIQGNDAANELHGGNGNDKIAGGAGADQLFGELGNDVLWGGDANDAIDGGDGIDTASYSDAGSKVSVDLSLLGAQNTLGSGSDTLVAIENLTGSAFDDTLTGNDLVNKLIGGDGGDQLSGGIGDDQLYGEAGDDILIGGAGNDKMDGGLGIDTADYSGAGAGVTVSLGKASQDTIGAGRDLLQKIENLTGSGFDDILTGSTIGNVIKGGAGGDKIAGGLGNDILYGNDGADIFIFNSAFIAGNNIDQIMDFSVTDDTISLKKGMFSKLTAAGALVDDAFWTGNAAHDLTDRIIYDQTTGALYYDADGSGTAFVQKQFATIANSAVLTASDFVVTLT